MTRPRLALLALLALLLPVLLAPRGFVLSLCMCGTGWGSNVCTAVAGGAPAPLRCTCCDEACAASSDTSTPSDCPTAAQDQSCPHCRLATLTGTPVDFVDGPTSEVPTATFIALAQADSVALPAMTAPAPRTTGRAPPSPVVRIGLWPSVLPLRI